ncbi:DUF3291 domain-containing protein [Pseudonocardia lacus]|uniref:DUF3291 domain-containing protein n=1 Tax=Pseudonocardia lacus TaxID=2835865 RepID=UPI0027E32AFD|nr:DUF3291 domain-containing protein [Pseudonocardia lacus]
MNVARMRAPLDDPVMRGFTDALAAVNRLAEAAPGFVARSEFGHHVLTDAAGLLVVNVSLWADYAALHEFVYRSAHAGHLRRKSRWFLPTEQPSTALWWVAADAVVPSPADAVRRLQHLRRYGPTPQAFGLRTRFGPDGRPEERRPRAGGARR